MINDHTLALFRPLGSGLIRPLHDYSFGNLPATIHRLLTGETIGPLIPADCFGGAYPSPDKVVLILVDGFGWQFWQRFGATSRVMRRVVDDGILSPVSALFPSTTAASVTTLNLGRLPASHAVYEWNMYVPAYGETIQSLAFATLGDKPVTLDRLGRDARDLVAGGHETVHQRLAAHGVASIQLAHRSYADSPFNRVVGAGARILKHATLVEALVQLEDVLAAVKGKALVGFYWAGLDTAAHLHGPGSRVHDREVRAFWQTVDDGLERLGDDGTLFLFTADHGHVGVPAERTIYINERWPELQGWLATSPSGRPILPNGSPRDVFVHIRPERRADAAALLRSGLADEAEVMTVDDALAHGLFGPEPVSDELRRRLGDVLILPRIEHFVWWREPGIMANAFHGHHGGLSPEELITVLGVWRGRME